MAVSIPVDTPVTLGNLSPNQGSTLRSDTSGDYAGRSVSSAGDVNGDGFADVIIGAPGREVGGFHDAGEAYVVFGSSSGFGSLVDLANLTPAQGFAIRGVTDDDRAGSSVSSAGDVNNDGFDDLIVGAPSGSGTGGAHVVFGSGTGFSTLQGFTIQGGEARQGAGSSVAPAGDVNGDGIGDLIVGVPLDDGGAPDAGAAYVVFGSSDGFDPVIELADFDAGFIIRGAAANDRAGFSVSPAGDVNGDGVDDLILGAPHDGNGNGAGAAYVVFGHAAAFADIIDLADIAPSQGFEISGIDAHDGAGSSVAAAGDVNSDGFDDVVIGAPGADDSAGESYVVFGRAEFAEIDLAKLMPLEGFRVSGSAAGDEAGRSVAAAGDTNGDGFGDVLIGAPGHDGGTAEDADAGESYVLFGKATGFADVDLSTLPPPQGFRIAGADKDDASGGSVAPAGDVDGDGFDDVIIGADGGDGTDDGASEDAGEAHVVYGRPAAESAIGGSGIDSLWSGGGFDVLRDAAAGKDVITIPDLGFMTIDGGTGQETLAIEDQDGLTPLMDLTAFPDLPITGIETIDLTPGANVLTVALDDVVNNLVRVIEGDADDDVNLVDDESGAWVHETPAAGGNYHIWSFESASTGATLASLAIDVEVQVNVVPVCA